MNSTLRLLILLSFAALSQQPLCAQPCDLCGTTASEWIAGITIDGSSGLLDIPGGGVGGCANYALIDGYVAVLKKGVNHTFSLIPGFSGAAQSEYWKIWIDLDHDGDFDDPGELVYASGSGSTTTVSGSFLIPLSVNTGDSRLRVAMRRGSPPPDCGNYSKGQVLTYESAYIDECDISFYDACSREYLKQVNIQAINNSSSCGTSGYQDFTNISTTLNVGNAYPVQLTPGFFSAQHPERWLIWIDFNNDYDFDDPGEMVFDSGVTGSPTITTGMLNIPLSAQTTTTRMRIKMIPTDVNTVTLDPCDPPPGGFLSPDQYGEAEDYTVNISVAPAQGYCWHLQDPLPQVNDLSDVFFTDSNTGWAVGNDGFDGIILKTSNGGATWSQSLGATLLLYAVHFTDNQTGWAVGEGGNVQKTSNGGTTWTSQSSGTVNRLLGVYFSNNLIGWAVGVSGNIRKTSNGGTTWTGQSSGTTNSLNGVHFIDNQTGWAVGNNGTILKTSNGGTTWVSQSSGTTNSLSGVHFTDNQTGWAVGQGGTILKTSNGGTTWTNQPSGTTIWLSEVHFPDNQTGWAVGLGGTILKTSNGGTTWTSESSGTSNNLSGVYFTDNQTGCAVGQDGIILKYGKISVANFTTVISDLTVTFSNISTNATAYLWDFGDGQTSTLANPSHIYAIAGTYNACLTATGVCGNVQACHSFSVSIAQCPPPGFPQTGENCGSPIICEGLNNYCNTINNNNVARTFPCCAGWTLNNDEWFGFFAGSTTISIDITPSNCTPGSNGVGLQAAIYASCPPANPGNDWCTNNVMDSQCSCTENAFTLNSTSFVIGQVYWIVIDGCSGSVCDYTLNVTEGSTLGFAPNDPGAVTGSTSICQGSTTNYELPAVNGATIYNWILVPSNAGTIIGNDRDISVAWAADFIGIASLCVNTSNQCYSNTTQSCITVNVLPKPTATLTGPSVLCTPLGNSVNLPVALTGGPNWTFVYAINGVNQPAISTNFSPYNITTTQPGTYSVTGITNGFGCPGTGLGVVLVTSSDLNLTGIASNALCSGSPTGSINTTVTGGQGPYQYAWTGPSSIGNIPDPTNILSGNYTVTVTDVIGCTIVKSFTLQCVWSVTPTGRNHTIIIPANLASEVFGESLEIGDRIGIFYDSSGTGILKCGGYVVWQGQSTSFAAYGNDATAPARNGFNTGELFKPRIWRSATNQEFDATAQYAPIGSLGGLITQTNAFADDGISMITSIIAGTTHAITLNIGWNLISSYVTPAHPDMKMVFSPIATSVDIVKNCDGDSYIPQLMINGIGDWNLLEGYQVKANQKDTLLVIGQKALPEANPIPLHTGWQCIAYLRNSPQNIATVFSPIQGQITIVKNNEGKIYSPQFGINTIGNMLPGQGYKVKAISNCTLLYQSNFTGGGVDERSKNTVESDRLHFVLDSNLNTGNNATIILMPSIADSFIHSGDEIGVFTPSGVLCGTAIYQGENFAITVWGDDPSTSGIIEGLQIGASYNLKVWNPTKQEEYTTMTTFLSGINAYASDAIEVITNIGLVSDMEDLTTVGVQTLQLFPNPASETLNIGIGSKTSGKVALTIFSLDGARVLDAEEIEYLVGNTTYNLRIPDHLPTGVYGFRFQFENGIVYRQVLLQK